MDRSQALRFIASLSDEIPGRRINDATVDKWAKRMEHYSAKASYTAYDAIVNAEERMPGWSVIRRYLDQAQDAVDRSSPALTMQTVPDQSEVDPVYLARWRALVRQACNHVIKWRDAVDLLHFEFGCPMDCHELHLSENLPPLAEWPKRGEYDGEADEGPKLPPVQGGVQELGSRQSPLPTMQDEDLPGGGAVLPGRSVRGQAPEGDAVAEGEGRRSSQETELPPEGSR